MSGPESWPASRSATRSVLGVFLLVVLLIGTTRCSRESLVEIDLLEPSAESSASRVEAALDFPASPVLQLRFVPSAGEGSASAAPASPGSDAVGDEEAAAGEAGRLRVSAHLADGRPVLLREEEIFPGDVVERLVSLQPLEGERALLGVSISGFRQVDWEQALVIGEARTGYLEDAPAPDEFRVRAEAGRPDLVVYLVDALRADALGSYGGPVATPNFDSIAEAGVRFDQAMTTATWTRPATASMLSGLYPSAHRVQDSDHVLSEAVFTLAERLKLIGYRTVGIVGNGNVDSVWGFDQGFDRYIRPPNPPPTAEGVPVHVRAPQLHELAVQSWNAPRDERPLFLFVHTVDPHAPYDPPTWELPEPRPSIDGRDATRVMAALNRRALEPTPELLDRLTTLYLGEVAYADRQFGSFMQTLRSHPRFPQTLFLLTSDHGDAHMEHRFAAHGMSLYEEELRIPLVVRFPAAAEAGQAEPARTGSSIQAPVSLIDVAPTLLAAAGAPRGGLPGVDLRELRGAAAPDRALLAELDYSGRRWLALRQGSFKLLRHLNSSRTFLFDLNDDTREERDLSEGRPELTAELARQLQELLASAQEIAPAEPQLVDDSVDDDLLENLRALGYVR